MSTSIDFQGAATASGRHIVCLDGGSEQAVLPLASLRATFAEAGAKNSVGGGKVALALAKPLAFLQHFQAAIEKGQTPVVLNPKLPYSQAEQIARALGCTQFISDHGNEALLDVEPAQQTAGHHVFCSSGTTSNSGLPKAFVYEMSRSLANARAHMQSLKVEPGQERGILLPLPITHSFGMMAGVMAACEYDLDLFIAGQGLTAQGIIETLHQHPIDTLYLTPSHVKQLVGYLKRKRDWTPPKVKRISIGSSVVISRDLLALMPYFPETNFYTTYGLTELGPRVSTYYAGKGEEPSPLLTTEPDLPTPLGEPIAGVSLKTDADRLWVQSPYRAVNLSDDEYFDTRDRVQISDRHIRVLGRSDDTIIRAGVNIYPEEVEARLAERPMAQKAVLVGLPSKTYGQVPVLAVERGEQTDDAATEAALLTFLKDTLPDTHVPVRVVFFDALPCTALGKIQRGAIVNQIMGSA